MAMWSNVCEGGAPQPDCRGCVCVCVCVRACADVPVSVRGGPVLQGIKGGKGGLAGVEWGSASRERRKREVEEAQDGVLWSHLGSRVLLLSLPVSLCPICEVWVLVVTKGARWWECQASA